MQRELKSLVKQRRMVGLNQHDVSQRAKVSLGRLVYAESGRLELESDEIERIQRVIKAQAQKVLDSVLVE
jgi:predicted transcriptional regulator